MKDLVEAINKISTILETFFREYLNEGNKLYIFLLGSNGLSNGYDKLSEIGAKVYKANSAREFCNLVLSDLE